MDALKTELRLALAMRGGVSLAVWIGGACAEIDQCRRALPVGDNGSSFWRDLLVRGQYERVVVDVLAGASAGGLNGVLYAASQIYDFSYSEMRDIWLVVGGTESLVRRGDPSPSLFKGDDYFQKQLFERLSKLVDDADDHGAQRPVIDLTLSATYIEPIERPVPSPSDEHLIERRFASGFRFRQPGATTAWTGTSFPDRKGGAATLQRAMTQLAVAGRSTSSFPLAFEAAAMSAKRAASFIDDSPPPAADVVDMGGVLLDRGGLLIETDDPTANDTFIVADGGILDNIPIGRALTAVAAAPAESKTERLLIYLQPGAAGAAKLQASRPLDVRRNTVSVLQGALRTQIVGETINADIAVLEEHNNAVARAIAIRLGTYRRIKTAELAIEAAKDRFGEYALTRSEEDARRVFALLCDPIGVLGCDPFPSTLGDTITDEKGKVRPVEVSDRAWRSPIAEWQTADREVLQATLAMALTRSKRLFDGTLTSGLRPLIRVAQLLIEWARSREKLDDPTASATASETKRRLYGVIEFLTSAVDTPRNYLWVSFAARRGNIDGNVEGFVDDARAAVDRLYMLPNDTVITVTDALRDGTDLGLEAAMNYNLARIPRLARGLSEDDKGLTDLRPHIVHTVLVPLFSDLAGIEIPNDSTKKPEDGDDGDSGGDGEEVQEPAALLERILRHVDPKSAADVLAALEVLSFAEFAGGLPGRRPIHFLRMSSANRTPLAPAFKKVLCAAADRDLWWGESKEVDDQQGIHVDLKLAGNELANFSAFLVSDWRANDWLWGRLDAVPTLVDVIVKPACIKELLPGADGSWADFDRAIIPDNVPFSGLPVSFEARVKALHDEALSLAELAGPKLENAPIPCIRDALIARRQFEILAEELALPWNEMQPPGDGTPLDPEKVWDQLATRRFGSETMQDNDHKLELGDRFNEITSALADTVVWNVNQTHPLGFQLSPREAQVARWTVVRVGHKLVHKFLNRGEKKTRKGRTKLMIAVAMAAVLAAGVLGYLMDHWAFFIGLGLGLAVIIPIALIAWSVVKKSLKKPPAVDRGSRRDLDVLRELVAEKRNADVEMVLKALEMGPDPTGELDLDLADTAFKGYALIDQTPSTYWIAFARKALEGVGRDGKKNAGARYAAVKAALEKAKLDRAKLDKAQLDKAQLDNSTSKS